MDVRFLSTILLVTSAGNIQTLYSQKYIFLDDSEMSKLQDLLSMCVWLKPDRGRNEHKFYPLACAAFSHTC
jgi:hypothetical protein